jgi:hypothetical protein
MAAWDGPSARFHRAAAAALSEAKAPGQVVDTLTLVRTVRLAARGWEGGGARECDRQGCPPLQDLFDSFLSRHLPPRQPTCSCRVAHPRRAATPSWRAAAPPSGGSPTPHLPLGTRIASFSFFHFIFSSQKIKLRDLSPPIEQVVLPSNDDAESVKALAAGTPLAALAAAAAAKTSSRKSTTTTAGWAGFEATGDEMLHAVAASWLPCLAVGLALLQSIHQATTASMSHVTNLTPPGSGDPSGRRRSARGCTMSS